MKYLTVTEVLVIYNEIIEETGRAKGLRDIRLLESAVARPQAAFGGNDLYPDLFSKTAALGHSIIRSHPFIDGNKRVGYMVMRLCLNINGYDLDASVDERYKFVVDVAQKAEDEESMAEWLKRHSKKSGRTKPS